MIVIRMAGFLIVIRMAAVGGGLLVVIRMAAVGGGLDPGVPLKWRRNLCHSVMPLSALATAVESLTLLVVSFSS